ncbi:MAG: hypothetical protein ACFE7R_10250, partial [Candidatus Hodarchaeota archaeon]
LVRVMPRRERRVIRWGSLTLDLAPDGGKNSKSNCSRDCGQCRRYMDEKCVGCPTANVYRGRLWSSPFTERKRRGKSKS